MTSDSLFTSILNFPTDFDNPFEVWVGGEFLDSFTAGDSIDFVSRLGAGVSEFTIKGLNVDPSNPAVFPIKLDFNTETASFEMYALTKEENEEVTAVPESSSVLGLLAFAVLGTAGVLKRSGKSSSLSH